MEIHTIEPVEQAASGKPDIAHIIFDTVYFSADSAVLSDAKKERICGMATIIAQHLEKTVIASRHTAFSDSAAVRQRISLGRV